MLGLIDGDTRPDVVIRTLEEALSVFFEPTKTENLWSAYMERDGIGLSLQFGEPVDTDFERACPHHLWIDTRSADEVGGLGSVFAKIAFSARFRAAMMVEGRDPLATTPGVPAE